MAIPLSPAVRVFPDADACAAAAAQTFLELALAAVEAQKPFRVALSGGSTPKRLYTILASRPEFRDAMPWGKIHFFFSDERHVPPDHADSNYNTAKQGLFSQLPIPAANIHRVHGELTDTADAASRYQNTIAASFGGSDEAVPAFDLIFLGMGPDGHTASLFPGTTGLEEKKKWVIANHVPQLATDRVTFTYPLLNAAEKVLLLVTGADKAERLETILVPGAPEAFPVQAVKPKAGALEWYLDAAAAAKLAPPAEKSA
ncbi:6-phosphogluconolactonase [Verrucomicrobium sp. GAS474]|uniref:6-phosphogluconolactonase n=1 Tax=Verrucomicrobium sp. GAS474 TaxID=1882831 RepID=UPI0008798913|nr:6-phosphogluconolactonase [Verrucomicrobium sp. GAS474]SDT85902.1 6-phosphogluconolactonase [Verrucomicrobium sp. GAS474]